MSSAEEPVHFVKLLFPEEWIQFQEEKVYHGNASDKRDGFIHMSKDEKQMTRVRNKYFANQSIYKVKIDPTKLSDVRYEMASDGDLYPHQYGVVPLESVISVEFMDANI